MGYQGGYRGYNWKCFTEGDITPFVEMYSRHGLAESDQGDYPYLHDMGPRQWEGTIQYGLELGNKFGICLLYTSLWTYMKQINMA